MNSVLLPNLFIPGVQKAGTTALASFLAQHPDICLVEGKEAHVFDDPNFHAASNKLAFAQQKYASKLKHYKGERYILDATPITMLHPEFIKAAAEFCPNSKYIVMLRDPIERALSHYAMTKQRGIEPYSPTIAFLLEPWRMRGVYRKLPSSPFQSRYRDQSYLIRGLYQKQLEIMYSYVNKSSCKLIQQHTLLKQHRECLLEIFTFLDLNPIDIEKESVFSNQVNYDVPSVVRSLLRYYFRGQKV